MSLCGFAIAWLAAACGACAAQSTAPRGPVTDVLVLDSGAHIEVFARGADRVDAASKRTSFVRREDRVLAAARLGSRFVFVGGEPSKKGIVTLHSSTGEQLARSIVTKDIVHRVIASPDGKRCAIADADGRVMLLRVRGDALVVERKVCVHAGGAHALSFAPDGRRLASGGQDGLVLLHDLASTDGEKPREPRVLDDHRGAVLAVAFSPNGDEVASSSSDGAVRIHAASGRLLRSWLGLGRNLRALRWNAKTVVVACGDGRLRICDRDAESVRVVGEGGRALFSLVLRARSVSGGRGVLALAGTWGRVRVFDVSRR